MIAGGTGLSLILLAGLSFAERLSEEGPTATPLSRPVAASLSPVLIRSVSESAGTLRLSGTAEPSSVVVLTDRGERVRQVRTDAAGSWSASLPVSTAPMAIEATLYSGQGAANGTDTVEIRGVQTVFRIHRAVDRDAGAPPLILLGAPAAPSRIVSTPFGASPREGALSVGAVDYDDAGGVIFSGDADLPGRVRLYVADSAIGETRVGADGRWAFIAGAVMPLGEYRVRAELLPEDGSARASVSVPFQRLPPLADQGGEDGALSVGFEPGRWQIRRRLAGGGVQSTAIFAPRQPTPPEPR